MPQWKQYSGTWPLAQQMQAVAAGTWTGIPQYSLYAWGHNNWGQLALSNTVNKSSPTQVGTGTDWGLNNGAAGYFKLFVKSNGSLWSVGNNQNGSLGQNDVISRSSPTQVGALTTWLVVSANYYHGGSFAIKNDGTLWSWGKNHLGQLGHNDVVYRSSPVQVGSGTTWSKICGFNQDAIAIKTDGTLWSWGYNANGESGQNNVINTSSPVQVGALTNWSLLPLGGYNLGPTISVIKTDGTLWSWGNGINGAMGDNTTVSKSSPIQIGALTNWSKIEKGRQFSVAIKTDGTLWGWGLNNGGQIGLGNLTNTSSPVQIGADTNWSKIAAAYSAAAAIKTDGTLWIWGNNGQGQLGQNDIISRSSPVQVGSDTNWVSVFGGDLYSFGAIKVTYT